MQTPPPWGRFCLEPFRGPEPVRATWRAKRVSVFASSNRGGAPPKGSRGPWRVRSSAPHVSVIRTLLTHQKSNPYAPDAKDAPNDRNVRIRIRSQRTGEQGDALGQPDYSQLHCPFTKTGTSVPSAMIPVMSISSVPIIKSTCVAEVFTPWAASASASIS